MAKVLAAIARFALENVLVAVELVLESGVPSAEHIENMLNRLKSNRHCPRPSTRPCRLARNRLPIPVDMTVCVTR